MSTVYTIGHSTHPKEEFEALLKQHAIKMLVDVRSIPGSARNPQFGKGVFQQWIEHSGILYVHLPEIGGRRKAQDADPMVNAGWRLKSFHNYADYTLTDEYMEGIRRLEALAKVMPTVFVCSEAMPWRCHRHLIADTLTYRGWDVQHIYPNGNLETHKLGTGGAVPHEDRARGRLIYPPEGVLI